MIYYSVGDDDPVLARQTRPLDDGCIIRDDWQANCVRISMHPGVWRDIRAVAKATLMCDVARAR